MEKISLNQRSFLSTSLKAIFVDYSVSEIYDSLDITETQRAHLWSLIYRKQKEELERELINLMQNVKKN